MMGTNENHKKIQQIDFVIPGEDYENDGKMKWMVLNDYIFVGYIDIYSRFLPKSIFTAFSTIDEGKTPIKINYCFRGRCEVKLGSGATTFVVGDELAIDYGTSNNDEEAFFIPHRNMKG